MISIEDIINRKIELDIVQEIKCLDIDKLFYISKMKGAYIIIFEGNKKYIGATCNINRRLRAHRMMASMASKKIDYVIFLKTKDINDAYILEDWLIKRLDPELNGILHKSKRYYRVLELCDESDTK